MSGSAGGDQQTDPPPQLDRAGYVLHVDDDFRPPELNRRLWLPHYLPQWSSREASKARYRLSPGGLRLLIEADQLPWCPEYDGWLRVSNLQTGVFAGPLGSGIGQHQFRPGLRVREEQVAQRLYLPRYGLFEIEASALGDPANMVALWMIGYEERPEQSAEICIFEIFGRDVGPSRAIVGMGIHPFGDRSLVDDFERVSVEIDACQSHSYAAAWTADWVAFYIDERLVKVSRQSPAYEMQFMLNLYEFAAGPEMASRPTSYPKEFAVQRFRAYRPR